MCTLQLCLAGTAVLTLLAGVGGVAVAQTDDDPRSAEISARLDFYEIVDPGTMAFGDEAVLYRGLIESGIASGSSDPRFDGRLTWTGHRDQHTIGSGFDISHGSYRIENEQGAWQGQPTVWLDAVGYEYAAPVTAVFIGEGAYAGWTVVAEISEDENFRIDGVIFKGDIPPAPEAVE